MDIKEMFTLFTYISILHMV